MTFRCPSHTIVAHLFELEIHVFDVGKCECAQKYTLCYHVNQWVSGALGLGQRKYSARLCVCVRVVR